MTADQTRFVHEAIKAGASGAGFQKEGSCWRSYGPEAILVIEPQRSQYGPLYFLNFGAYVRSLGDIKKPRELDWHVRARLSSVLSAAEVKPAESLLDFNLSMDDQDRHRALVEVIRERVVPFLGRCATLESIFAMHAAGDLKRMLVKRTLTDLQN